MLVHPRPMCPRPKILGCCIPWTKCPLAILPLTEPSHPFDLILCVGRACIRRRGANPINLVRGVGEAGQTPHWSIRRRRPTEAAIAADGARSRVGTHQSGTQYSRDALFKGRNIQELLVGDTSVGETSTGVGYDCWTVYKMTCCHGVLQRPVMRVVRSLTWEQCDLTCKGCMWRKG
jgi:hypothetical protein